MIAELKLGEKIHRFDAAEPIDISIPLNFNAPQPNAYGVPPATAEACVSGDLVGDTRRGGSCNFEKYTFIPHCNGTHTESVGHITHARISVRSCLRDIFVPARLITIDPVNARGADEAYSSQMEAGDKVITRTALDSAGLALAPLSALIVRTTPNDDAKLTRRYVEDVPPYFTTEAMRFVVECGFTHLAVDLPSIDRLYDQGKLSNHRIFWNVDPDTFEIKEDSRIGSTITELIYVPNAVEDGDYLLNLQIAPFSSDASPSRPILFRTLQN